MDLIKKNLTFTVVLAVCLLIFVAGAYFAFSESGTILKAQQQISSAEARLNSMLFADPAPTEANVAASQQNVAQLEAVLESIRADLQRGARLSTSTDGIGVMAGIQQYISEYQRKAAAQMDANGEAAPISLPKDFAFGFEQYINEAKPLDDQERSATLDKQRQILSYLLNRLFDAKPAGIVSVKREVLERGSSGQNSDKNFQISSAISARVPGAIDTLAFSMTFTAYTDSLRSFLNDLAKFDLPIVVRSIEVTRPTGSQTTAAPARGNNLDAIFGVFGGQGEADAPKEAQKPVISENISTFTVTLEFIEIVLPADFAEDNV